MNLKSRLSRLQSQCGATPTPIPVESDLKKRLEDLHRIRQESSDWGLVQDAEERLASAVDGHLISPGLIRIHSRIPVRAIAQRYGVQSLNLDPRLPGEPAKGEWRNLYLDTETTGLSGGSGTLGFLLGCAWAEKTHIILEQWLMTRFSGEPDLLRSFSRSLRPGTDRLVSYNGKSFDLPLLRTRYRMHALPWDLDATPHLDLLHPVRRLFARHWPDCRLTTLEKRLLGFQRTDDLPGAEAPDAWFDFIRRQRGERLIRIVQHHRDDILSLIVTHARIEQMVQRANPQDLDACGLAKWLLTVDPLKACRVLQQSHAKLDQKGKLLLAQLLQRSGQLEQARVIWETLAENHCTEALERMAKYHEHVSKALPQARAYSLRLPEGASKQHRLARLEKKLFSAGTANRSAGTLF
ncbi:MAG: ribonuclease H-like domain-containing protein [Candidatus Thiodiazotropha sp.]